MVLLNNIEKISKQIIIETLNKVVQQEQIQNFISQNLLKYSDNTIFLILKIILDNQIVINQNLFIVIGTL